MKISAKIMVLALIFTSYNAASLADTVYFQFRHVDATTGAKPSGNGPFLCFHIGTFWHNAGQQCFDRPSHNVTITGGHDGEVGLPRGGFLQDHVNTGLGISSVYGVYHLHLICRKGRSYEDIHYTAKDNWRDINVNHGNREIDINASCPIDENGNLLPPVLVSETHKP